MYKEDLALNNLQWLICHKTKPNLITLSHIQQESRRKKHWVKAHSPYSADLVPNDIHQYGSLQNARKYKIFSQEDQAKTFVKLNFT